MLRITIIWMNYYLFGRPVIGLFKYFTQYYKQQIMHNPRYKLIIVWKYAFEKAKWLASAV